jgi:hypothetical protein
VEIMAIRTGKSFKVVEQSHDGDGCGAVLASYSSKVLMGDENALAAANERAAAFARENPGTRYYVMATCSGTYVDASGGTVRRTY